MIPAGRVAAAVVLLLLTAGPGPAAGDPPLPGACAVLQGLPADDLAGQAMRYETTQDRASDDVVMSLCSGLDADGLAVVTLLLRQDTSAFPAQPGPAQREAMIAELAETFGQQPDVETPDIGEAALWVADIGQLAVWTHGGRVMLIVTAGGIGPRADADLAIRIGREIVARFPQ